MLLRIGRGTGATLGLASVFALSASAGLLIHSELPPTRRMFGRIALGLVNAEIQGSIEVDSVERLSARGLEVRGARVRDASGRVVLDADRLEAQVATRRLVSSALFGSGDIEVLIPLVRSERMTVQLEQAPDASLTLAQAFAPRPKPPRPPTAPPTKPPRNVVVDLPHIEIGTASAFGNLPALGAIDAEARTIQGRMHVGPDGVSVDADRGSLIARKPLPVPLVGSVDVHVRSPGAIWVQFVGLAGEIELAANAKLQGNRVDATVDVPSVRGETIAALVPGLQLREPARGRIELHGDLGKLQTLVSLRTGTAQLDARGPITTSGSPKAELDLEARGVDLSAILVDAPPTLLGADAHLDASLSGAMKVKATGKTLPGAAAGIEIPGTDFDAKWEGGRLTGSAKVHEPGIPIDATFEVANGGISVKATSRIAQMGAAPRLQGAAHGTVSARLEASWREGQIDALVSADVGSLSREPIRLREGHLHAHAWGPPSKLVVDASLTGSGVEAAGLQWKDGRLDVRGPVLSPRVEVTLRDRARPHVNSTATLSLGKGLAASDLVVKLGRRRDSFTFHAEKVDIRDGVVDFGGIAVDGLGQPVDGVVQIGASGFDVRLVSSGVDVGKLADVLGLDGPKLSGTAAIDIDVRNSGDRSTGCVKVDLKKGQIGPIPFDVGAALRARLGGSHVEFDSAVVVGTMPPKAEESGDACMARLSIPDGQVVAMRADGDVTLAGSPLQAKSWSSATGTAKLTELGADFGKLKAAVALIGGGAKWNLPEVGGSIKVGAEISRSDRKLPPSVSANIATEQFGLTIGAGSEALRLERHDLVATASIDPTGKLHTEARVVRSENHEQTVVARLGSDSRLDWAQLIADPAGWRKILGDAELGVKVHVPQQPLSSVFAPWLGGDTTRLPVQSANVSLGAELSGTFRSPQLAMQAYVDRPTYEGESLPALMCFEGSYDGHEGMVRTVLRRGPVDLSSPGACSPNPTMLDARQQVRDVGMVLATFKAPWEELRKANSLDKLPVQADAQFKIDGLPLSELGDGTTRGELNGSGGVRGLGRDPELVVNLGVQGLRVGSDFAYDRGSLTVRADATGLRGGLDLVDATRGQDKGAAGRLEADVTSDTGLRWIGGWNPKLSEGQAIHLRVKPSRFRASSLKPFVEPMLSYVEGDITGYVDATISSGTKPSRIDDAFLSLTGGALQIPTIGQEFIDVSAIVRTSAPDQLMIDGFRANAVSGKVAGTAAITLEDLKITRATAGLSTDKANKLRLTLEGVPIGDVWGSVSARLDAQKDTNDVRVDLRGVQVELTEADQRSLQSLAPNPEIRVLPEVTPAQRSGWTFTQPAAPAPGEQADKTKPWLVTVGFADPVRIERQGMRFSVTSLQGGRELPKLIYPDPDGGLRMEGSVRLDEGRVDVVGKFFTIEPDRAFVYFDGSASNPELNVTARWDAPDGTRVYADVTGRLQEPHVQLRSDPARPPGEVLALILFGGSSDRSTSTPAMTRAEASRTGAGGGAAAAGVGSGVVAAAGLNSLLSGVAPVGISTRVDTSQRNNVRPTVIVDVASNVTAEATVNTGAVPLGQNPDRYLLTLDWRFLRKWSLRTTVGDAGSSILDVLWTHRY